MKRKFLTGLLTASAMTVMMGATAFADAPSGEVAHYTFDGELDGATTVGVSSTAKQGEEAEIEVVYADGIDGKAINVGKTADNGGAVKLDKTFTSSNDGFTISFAAKNMSWQTGGVKPMLWIGAADQSTENWVSILSSGSGNSGATMGGNTGPNVWSHGPATTHTDMPLEADANKIMLVDNEWAIITVTVQGSSATSYVNGQKMYEGDIAADVILEGDASIYIGQSAWSADCWTAQENDEQLLIDEVWIYDEVLDETAISDLVEASHGSVGEAAEEATTKKSIVKAGGNDGVSGATTTETEEESTGMSTGMIIGIVAAIVVVIVIIIVVVAAGGKKKKKNLDDDE